MNRVSQETTVHVSDTTFPEKNMTAWQLGEVLRATADMIEKIQNAPLQVLDNATQHAADKVAERIVTFHKNAQAARDECRPVANEMAGALNDSADKIIAGVNRLEGAMHHVGRFSNAPDCFVPIAYMKDICDLADRFSHLTPEQWSRVVELASALSGKK